MFSNTKLVKIKLLFQNCRMSNIAGWTTLVIIGWATTFNPGQFQNIFQFTLNIFIQILPLAVFAFLLTGSFFSINNAFDIQEDISAGKTSNLVARGLITKNEAILFSILLAMAAVAFFSYIGGFLGFLFSITCTVLGFLYSVPPVRFKKRPILDIVSHGLFLGSLLILIGTTAYGGTPNQTAYFFAVGFFVVSCLFQMQNLLGDYFIDRDLGIKTTAVHLRSWEKGRYFFLAFATIGLIGTVVFGWYLKIDWLLVLLLVTIQVVNIIVYMPWFSVYRIYLYQLKVQPIILIAWGVALLIATIIMV
ncbi:MAG: UbiA family prenyltransferase [Candidatus Freyarchaeota archaeon]